MDSKNRLRIVPIVEFLHPLLIVQKRRALREEDRESAKGGIFRRIFPIVAGFTVVRQVFEGSAYLLDDFQVHLSDQ